MKIRKNRDIFLKLTNFHHILSNKPSPEAMLDEIKMMRFKIRPLLGDISLLDFKNKQFIEVVWRLGKLDDFFRNNLDKTSRRERRILINMFEQMRGKFEKELNLLSFKKLPKNPQLFEMEIIKESSEIGKIN